LIIIDARRIALAIELIRFFGPGTSASSSSDTFVERSLVVVVGSAIPGIRCAWIVDAPIR